jgi:hypothetical protein
MTTQEIQKQLENDVQILILKFEEKQGIEFGGFVGDDIFGIADFGSTYFFNMADIYYDIITEQPKGQIINWLEDSLENREYNINYRSYCMGLRIEQLKKIKRL